MPRKLLYGKKFKKSEKISLKTESSNLLNQSLRDVPT